jgi:predicted ferric reductase
MTSVVTRRARAPRAGLRAQVLLGLIVAGAVVVLALWWHDTPRISGFGDWLTNAGRVTGLLAGYVIAVLLLLMARIPSLERGVGADRLARWHSMGGRYTVSLSVAHTLLVIWGYAVTAHESVFPQTWQLLTRYPDVLMATVALGLLVLVGVVSARAVRLRMRYETWYFLHFYTYLAIALSFAHVFATGGDFAADRTARVCWSALYIGVGLLLCWFRFVVPVRSAVRHRMVVDAVVHEGPGIYSVHVGGHHLRELGAEPGQFFRWRFLTPGDWWQSHPYSLSAPASDSLLRFTVKALGDHSKDLQNVRKGTRIFAEGPYGALTAARRRNPKVLLLAGGIGVTPLRSLFETLPAADGDLTLLYRANTELDVVFRAELEAIAAWRGARVLYLTGPPAGANDPLTGRRLAGLLPDIADHDVYLCGPPRMMDAAFATLRRVGVPKRHIHTESFEF